MIRGLVILLSLLASNVVFANDNLYVFVFKNGAAQKNILIDIGGHQKKTDEFGLANFELQQGEYEIGYFDPRGELFELQDFVLLEDQQSQIFLNLSSEGSTIDLDLPLAAYVKSVDQAEIKPMEGPKGKFKVKLVDSKTNKPVSKAKLYFRGYDVEGQTDENGEAIIELSRGPYDISVIHPKYSLRVVRDIKIEEDKTNQQTIKMTRADIMLDEFVVSAPSVEGSLASTFAALKESDVVADAISAEQFSKSGDSSAAGALKRVTGITIVGGKYVYVRGLGERYSAVMLNDLYVPSPEPTKRVVPLDIIPSSVIQSMNIQKTYSADLPANFAGGDVLIASKDIPKEDNYIGISLSGSFNSDTGKSVFINNDNDLRLPQDIIDKSANFAELQKGYPPYVPGYTDAELKSMYSAIANYRSYNLSKTNLKPGSKVSVNLGQSFKTSGGVQYGVVGTIYAGNSSKLKQAIKYNTVYDIPNEVLLPGEKSEYQQTSIKDKLGGLISFGVDDLNGNKVKFTHLTVDDKSSSTTFSEKDGGPQGPGQKDQQRTYLEYKEKNITANQLNGEHLFNLAFFDNDLLDDIEISWAAETAAATRLEPGTVEYTYEKNSDTTDFALDKKIWFLYSDLKDKLNNYRVDIKLPYEVNDQKNYTSFGLFGYNKSRTLDNRRFKTEHGLGTEYYPEMDSAFTQANVDNDDIVLTSNYRASDAYTATHNIFAFYLNQLFSVTQKMDVFAGLRKEDSRQQLIDTKSGDPYSPLLTDDWLASMSVNYSLSDDHKLRFGFANTLSRPDFREFSPNRYKDPITENIVFGYPDLKYTTINNLDFKYEWYLSYDEVFSIGLFAKDFTNPVETIEVPDDQSQSNKKIVTYRNALGGTSSGIEVSIRKKLNFWNESWSNYFVSSNLSLIDSTIRLNLDPNDEYLQYLTTSSRPMQGQSPYVFNFKVGYDNLNTGRSAILLFNEYGKRISALGTKGAPDVYELPFSKLDFVVKWRINDTYDEQVKKIGYNLDFKIGNILNSSVVSQQGDKLVESYKPGTDVSFSFSMKY